MDLDGCRAALERHHSTFPSGPDPTPVREAARWLEARLPRPDTCAEVFCSAALGLARDLREGRASPCFSALGHSVTRTIACSVCLRAIARATAEGMDPVVSLSDDLPWGALHVFPGRWAEAEAHLATFLSIGHASAAAYAALGDCRWNQGREGPAYLAYREAAALDPWMGGWAVDCRPLADARAALEAREGWSGGWWAVGAYLDGVLPSFGRAPLPALRTRWERFVSLRSQWPAERGVAPPLFFAGLFLSENADSVLRQGDIDLEGVRRLLSELHPEAWQRHWEALDDPGAKPGRPGLGR